MHSIDYIATTLSLEQHGIFTKKQLVQTGYTLGQINHYANNSHIHRVFRGIYYMTIIEKSYKSKLFAVSCLIARNLLISHESALYIYGLIKEPKCIEVTLDRSRRISNQICKPYYVNNFCKLKSNCFENLNLVTLERAILTCADRFNITKIEKMITQLVASGKSGIENFQCELELLTHTKHRKVLSQLLEKLKVELLHIESMFELRVQNVIRENDLREPVKQYLVKINGRNFRLDFAYPDRKICIEADGFAYHSTKEQLLYDQRRQNALILDGWTIIRVTPSMTDREIANFIANALV